MLWVLNFMVLTVMTERSGSAPSLLRQSTDPTADPQSISKSLFIWYLLTNEEVKNTTEQRRSRCRPGIRLMVHCFKNSVVFQYPVP